MSDPVKPKFLEVYTALKSHLVNDSVFEWDDSSRIWVQRVLDYNVPLGKLNRGISVVDSYKLLKGSELTHDEFFQASALGWCIEWLQAFFLVHDDMMDNSQTRRGQPCWYKLPEVGMIAINDAVLIRNQIHRILKTHFKGKPYYVDLVDLFSETEYQTSCGQMIDLTTTLQGKNDLSKYNMDCYRRIVQYKTAYYSFYLSVASALVLFGENLENHVDVKNILIDMGTYFQVQDDFLDCFGDPAFIGKIGTDIEDFKCSWLVVKALELCDDEQRQLIAQNYGKEDPKCVAKVKELYRELKLEASFEEYERKSYERMCKSIDAHPSSGIQDVLRSFLGKIYKRQK